MISRTTCPISGQPSEVVYRRPYAHPDLRRYLDEAGLGAKAGEVVYEIRYCIASGLFFQNWVMEDAELAGMYSSPRGVAQFEQEISQQRLHWFAHMADEVLVLRQSLKNPRPVVLDFGSNWGKWSSMALAFGCDVHAVEVNREAAAFCASRGIKIIAREELGEPRFDFIQVDQVLEHLTDPLGAARLLARSLKPGGLMKWGTPNAPKLPVLLSNLGNANDGPVPDARTLDPLLPLMHVNLFSKASLTHLAKTVGLEPFRPSLGVLIGSGQMWNMPRQLNRNVVAPFKRWRLTGTELWFRRPLK